MRRLTALRVFCALLLTALILLLSAAFLFPRVRRTVYPVVYREEIEAAAAEFAVPPEICFAVVFTESGFDETALSRAGAVGLMQLMPSTFTYLCAKLGEELPPEQIYDANTNLRLGIYYLSLLHRRFGVWETVYAAYNAGPSRVAKWLKEYGQDGILTEIPIEETKTYVARVSRAAEYYKTLYQTEESKGE